MFERYTETARRTIFFARYEASQFGSACIETEHLLLGLLRDQVLVGRFLSGSGQAAHPPELDQAEERMASVVARIHRAVAIRDFQQAQACLDEAVRAEGTLRQVREKYNLPATGTREPVSDDSGKDAASSIRRQVEANTQPREKVSTSVDLPLSHASKRALAYAYEEAKRMNHETIGTHHLLLGLLREESSLAARILRQRGVELPQARNVVASSGTQEGRNYV